MMQPRAIQRLGVSIFVPQRARRLVPKEYEIIYVDTAYFGDSKPDTVKKQIKDLAIVLSNERLPSSGNIIAYADRQKDRTGIGLSGNEGSGRAVYYGDRFNILGVGKTTLCKSIVQNHSTGRLEIVGAMRRIILSQWINYFTKRTPVHPLLIALKETTSVKWNPDPIPLSLLIRIDNGDLDRPSHVEQSPEISIHFKKIISEYAKLDAECFAYRILQGAWSTSNYSLNGCMIDLESASFVKYRSPSYTSSSKHPHNRFGYEGLGLLRILRQLAGIKNISATNIERHFYRERRKHLGRCFLSLLGMPDDLVASFFAKHQNRVLYISGQFETLSKKINTHTACLNLYAPIPDNQDPSLLNMSNLFKNLAELYGSPHAETKAFEYLIRKEILPRMQLKQKNLCDETPHNQTETFLKDRVIVSYDQSENFLKETKNFINDLFRLLDFFDSEKYFEKKDKWDHRLRAINQDIPPMYELNKQLISLATSYRLGVISPQALGAKLETLCTLPIRSM